MQLKKTILSLVLLLSYSLGFAHNLLPHCSNPDQFSHSHHELHEHHSEQGSHDANHEHIAHDNHEDESLYDFLLCLLGEVDHHYHYELNTDFTFSKISELNLDFSKVSFNAVLVDEFAPCYFSIVFTKNQTEFKPSYRSPIIGYLRHRGPPHIT